VYDSFFNEDMLLLAEVYYSDEGVPEGYCNPHFIFDSITEVHTFTDRIKEASEKPILDESIFKSESDKE
jgi:hypothetical protein